MGKKQKKGQIGAFICGFIIFVIFIFPLYWMVVTALKTQVEIFEIPTPLWPRNLSLDAFKAQLPHPVIHSVDSKQCYHCCWSNYYFHCFIHTCILWSGKIPLPCKKSHDPVLPDHTDASIYSGTDIIIYHVLKSRTVKYILGTNPGRCYTWYSFQYYHSENLFPVHPEGTG